MEEHEERVRPKWRVGADDSFTSTGLHFGNGLAVDEVRNSALVTLDYRPVRGWTLEVGAGAILGGTLTASSAKYALGPGFATVAGVSWRVIDADRAVPFVLLTSQLSYASSSSSGGAGYNAFDLRLGAAVGTTFRNVLTPYVAGRAFGGPIYWRYQGAAIVGTDDHHWQAGVGLSVLLAQRADFFLEGMPLGELGVTAGGGVSF